MLLQIRLALAAAPNKVGYFTASSYNLYSGESTLLRWGQPLGSTGTIYYNLSVKKPNKAKKILKLRNTQSQSFNRTLNTLGIHIFYVQACNEASECSLESIVKVMVKKRKSPPKIGQTPKFKNSNQPINKHFRISWPSVENASYYLLYENEKQIYRGSNQFTDINSQVVGYRHYTVVACNNIGCGGRSGSASVYYYGAANEVENLRSSLASQQLNEYVALTWSIPEGAVTGVIYHIFINESLENTTNITRYNAKVKKNGPNIYQVIACNPNSAGCGKGKSISVLGVDLITPF
ncbi:hypothetical protein [Pseudoalteromonas denitrificans]|nr:hypothetical protein [Pseudoalteromonas denitrificans]